MMTGEAMAMSAAEGPEVSVLPIGPTQRRIELRGILPVGWAGRLASGLSSQRIGVVRGWAAEGADGRWEARFEVELPRYTIDLTPVAVLQLSRPDPAPLHSALDGLELLDFRLAPSGDDLVVELEAADARGFLDRVLRLFAQHGLFPRELSAETSDGLVHDLFRLHALHGGPPERATVEALAAKLARVRI